MLTREYPPDVYGGAGVHVEYLSRELSRLIDLEVRCFGPSRFEPGDRGGPTVHAYQPWEGVAAERTGGGALGTMSVDLAMAAGLEGAEIVHSHTWYANLGGHVAKMLRSIPHVMTSHSLEPLRPWKAEQLGAGGYALSSFCERSAIEGADAVIAVSASVREDVLRCYPQVDPERVHVIHNGIDPEEYRPVPGTDALDRYGVDPGRPSVLFVGRVTRQKGLTHLLEAALRMDPEVQLVLVAGAPDTQDLAAELAAGVARVREQRTVVWIEGMIPRADVIQLLSHATVFCCPSIYEPLGIVNLEAMACQAAVVATATGGITEVVEDGVTGLLVPFDPVDDPSQEPRDPAGFALALAERIDAVVADPSLARRLGEAGRLRAVERFSWSEVARRTVALYGRLIG